MRQQPILTPMIPISNRMKGGSMNIQKKILFVVALIAVLVCAAVSAHAAVRYVPCDAYPTIQSAINAAVSGDVVSVAPGVYNESLYIRKSNVKVTGAGAAVCSIAPSSGRVVGIDHCTNNCVLEGFTITGGNEANGGGIAVYWDDGSTAVKNCTITGNVASNRGGGLYAERSSITLEGNTICNNSAPYGGGVYLWGSSAKVTGNVIKNNAATSGGGIYHWFCGSTMSHNVVTGNSATGDGGGVCIANSGPIYTENVISSNTADGAGGGLTMQSGGGGARIYDNVIIDNNSGTYGGGFKIVAHGAHVINNTLSGNYATVNGGGCYLINNGSRLEGNHFFDNEAGASGGGIYAVNCPGVSLINNAVTYNAITTGTGGGIFVWASTGITVDNNYAKFNTPTDTNF